MTNNRLEADKINLKSAMESQLWRMVGAGEPNRQIDVRMSYYDLENIVDMLKGHNCEG